MKIKTKISLFTLFSFLIFFTFSTPVLAQNQSPSPWQQREQLRQQRQTRLTTNAKQRIKNIYNRIHLRLQQRIERLERIAQRLLNRADFFESKGKQTSGVREQIARAQNFGQTAKTDLEAAKALLEQLVNSDDPKALFPELKDAVKKVRDDIVQARQALAQAVQNLVNLKGGQGEE